MLTFGSLFAGIGGFDLGFERAGMRGIWQVEKDKQCLKLLAGRFPNAERFDDVATVGDHNLAPVDVICGGFPCQDLSVAGKRAGLKGGRSGLFFEMTRIVNEIRPALLVWENVPGLLSSNRGKDFLVILLELERIGYYGCWTTLDARWFGLAQRRRRVFGVFARGDIGAAACAEILSLQARLRWDSGTSQEKGRVSPPLTATGVGAGRTGNERNELDFCVPTLTANDWKGPGHNRDGHIVPTMRANGDAHSGFVDAAGLVTLARCVTAREGLRQKVDQDNFIAVANRNSNTSSNGHGFLFDGTTHTLGGSSDVVAFNNRQDLAVSGDVSNPLGAKDNGGAIALPLRADQGSGGRQSVTTGMGVRRLTPLECERLQGFPDGHTEGFADSVRYKMCGNAVAVPCAEWIGGRIRETIQGHA